MPRIKYILQNFSVLLVALITVIFATGQPRGNLKIVVLGSSTAAGTGATTYSNWWVSLLTAKLVADYPDITTTVANLAIGGSTTYHILPTGTTNPGNRPVVDPAHNISAALALSPRLILINMPSNDVAGHFTSAETMNNFATVVNMAHAAGVGVILTGTQPRSDISVPNRQILQTQNQTLLTTYGSSAVDIYSELVDLSDPVGSNYYGIKPIYSFGDNIHVNNAGHNYIYTQVLPVVKAWIEAGSRLYVNASATGANNGSNWADAYTSLGGALSQAKNAYNITEIWVAAGTYYPTENDGDEIGDRFKTFALRSNLRLNGGFSGTETQLSQRNRAGLPSTLSGNTQQDQVETNNVYHVVKLINCDTNCVLDGFTIQNGYADGTGNIDSISWGAGILIFGGGPVISNCILSENKARSASAIYHGSGQAIFSNVLVVNNRNLSGGGIVRNDGTPTYRNISIADNSFGSPNTTIMLNETGASPTIRNSIIRGSNQALIGGTSAVTYSIIQGSLYPGTGNVNADPLFLNEGAGNLRLRPCSPAINAGVQAGGTTIDLVGVERPAAGGVDIGAFERSFVTTIFVDSTATGGADGSRWEDAYPSFYNALQEYNGCDAVDAMIVAKGTYPAPVSTPFVFDKSQGQIMGGYPSGGGVRNAAINPVILKGNVQVLGSMQIEGIRVKQ
jgi:lysophospholipase L1-like esterase